MFKSNILFTGYYGHKNTGDDAFVEVAEWGARQYWKKDNNRFLAISQSLPHTKTETKGYPFSVPKSYQLQSALLIRNTQCLISAGGSTIHSKFNHKNYKSLAMRHKNAGNDIKIGGIGVSIGPFRTLEDEKEVQKYLQNIDFLAVRDQTSYDYVSNLNLPYQPINAFDLAALLPEIYNFNRANKKVNSIKIIGVSVCPYESLNNSMNTSNEIYRNDKTVSLLTEIDKKEEVHFKFFVINGNTKNGDLELTLETIKRVKPKSFEIVTYSSDTELIWKSISNCDFVIATRLHAAIFACFSETPFMLNEYHRKCTDFLDNVGHDYKYRLNNSEYNLEDKVDHIINIINNSTSYSKPKRIKEMILKAEFNFSKISF